SSILEQIRQHPSNGATFLNACKEFHLSNDVLGMLLRDFVLPWIVMNEDAALQILLHQFTALKWILIEHALITTQGQHLVNQYAHVVKELSAEMNPVPSLTKALQAEEQQNILFKSCHDVCTQVKDVLARVWPDANVFIFGSSLTGLCSSQGDIDLCVLIPSNPVRGQETVDLALDMHEHLSLYFPTSNSMVIRNARIPVIKTQIDKYQVDICINNTPALWNSLLIKTFIQHYPPLRQLCLFVRTWATHRSLIKSANVGHSLSSYSFVLLTIYWLQVRGYLPFVDIAYEDSLATSMEKIQYSIDAAFAEALSPSKTLEHQDIAILLLDFFVFYSAEFSYVTEIASLRRRQLLKPKQTPILHLEDPIEIDRNLGSYLNKYSQRTLRMEFIRMCVLSRQELHQDFYDLSANISSLSFVMTIKQQFPPVNPLRPRCPLNLGWIMTGDAVSREQECITTTIVKSPNDFPHTDLSKLSVIGVDCEGSHLGREGKLAIVTIAVGPDVFLFDLLESPDLIAILKPILESDQIVKVFHDCRKDSDALFHQCQIRLKNVFDTQTGHALLYFQRKPASKNDKRYLKGPNDHVIMLDNANNECLGYADLLWHYLSLPPLPIKEVVKESMTSDDEVWLRRPLSNELLQYAANDVVYLSVLYRIMNHAMGDQIEQWKLRSCANVDSCEWTFDNLNASNVRGYIHNITSKQIYFTISPSVVGILSISEPEKGNLPENAKILTLGTCVKLHIKSQVNSSACNVDWVE
ncbi:hypothetical protein THRCLA_10358, partial [Thraustotheca clavata]